VGSPLRLFYLSKETGDKLVFFDKKKFAGNKK